MPTAHREGSFRFFFYSNEDHEPPHVHVESGDGTAKFWLDDEISLAESDEYNETELNKLRRIIRNNIDRLMEAWNAHR